MSSKSNSSEIIKNVIASLPKDPLLHQFTDIYLGKIPARSLSKNSLDYLKNFILNRYEFFTQKATKKGQIKFEKHPETHDKHILEMVFPDAPFTILTLEGIIKNHGVPITRLHHPIFTVEKDKHDKITDIKQAEAGKNLISYVYAEIDHIVDERQQKAIESEIQYKMKAVQAANQDHCAITTLLTNVKESIAAQTGKRHKFHDEWVDLCDWLKNHNFSFFGYASYEITSKNDKKTIKPNTNSHLGILKLKDAQNTVETELTHHCQTFIDYRSPFLFDTIPVESPIQRFENLMRLSIKIELSETKTIEHNFLGLLKQSSLTVKNLETPIIRKKMETIFENKHILAGSYDYNQIIRICTATPKFELFRTPTEQLEQLVEDVLSITNPNEIYAFTRNKINHSRNFLLLIIPPSLYTTENIETITDYLQTELGYTNLEVIKASDEKRCRLHIHFDLSETLPKPFPIDTVESQIRALIKPWEEQLRALLLETLDPEIAIELFHKYNGQFPDHHQVRRSAAETVRDIQNIEEMFQKNTLQFRVVPFTSHDSALSGKTSNLFMYNAEKIDLISIMPTLENMGIHIFDELTTRIGSQENTLCYIHSFRISHTDLSKLDETIYAPILIELLDEIFKGRTTNDPLNALGVKARLNWRAINVFQTYRAFYLQLNTRYSKDKINQVLLTYPESVATLFNYFEAKFKPSEKSAETRLKKELPEMEQAFLETLNQVDEISDDIILKRFFNFIQNTVRTNFYIPKTNGDCFISVKFESKNIKLPLPIPFREIFVYDAEMEGCHIRFGAVARGGIRWSNRMDDFRREVLGLVKTQQTKNVVIVPVGSKGGFVIKKALKTREDAAIQSELQYKKLIKGMLDITDNINKSGQIVSPEYVIRYEGDDPYLVVAADKGTANFSDIANGISEEYRFWLGDAFASGGSVGYNHKEVAITAKGGWECVKLHFKALGKDIQKEEFTVSGVGDMSGDVFGNGMLLSKKIQLQAAFNHVHIFIDPNPDAERSFKERERLFKLPRSTWQDYNAKLISKGGGIFERKAKSIPLSPEIKALLGLDQASVNGEELIKAILKMKVELLWLGGIGTYIKAENQTHLDVGDPANDAIRINVEECNTLVIGEGANLGITQAARNKLSERGIKLNTDFIDNSAGVNMSDYEVNIKILLERMLNENQIKSQSDRNKILMKATDEVTELVLKNNRDQHNLLSMDALRSQHNADPFHKLIYSYVQDQFLNPIQETIPDQSELEILAQSGKPIPRPVLAVLQAYTKMKVFNEIVNTPLMQAPDLDPYYTEYFPESMQKKFGTHIKQHHLKKEIIATVLTNMIVNCAGLTFFFHVQQITGRSIEDIAKAYIIINDGLKGEKFREKIQASKSSLQVQYKALVEFEALIQALVIDSLQLPNVALNFSVSETLSMAAKEIQPKNTAQAEASWLEQGLEKNLASEMALLKPKSIIPDLIYLITKEKLDGKEAYIITKTLDEIFGFEWIKDRLVEIPASSHWEYSLKDGLSQSIRHQKISLIQTLIKSHSKDKLSGLKKENVLETLTQKYPEATKQYFKTLEQIKSGSVINLTSLTVTINRLNAVSL